MKRWLPGKKSASVAPAPGGDAELGQMSKGKGGAQDTAVGSKWAVSRANDGGEHAKAPLAAPSKNTLYYGAGPSSLRRPSKDGRGSFTGRNTNIRVPGLADVGAVGMFW